jgi:tRNA(fMet)-specific endonuclease VapC
MILDTNAVSALLHADPDLDRVLAGTDRHALPVIVIGEYRFGLLRSAHRRRGTLALDELIRECRVLPIVEPTTRSYAELRRELKEAGTPIPENDVWIAALARQHEEPVVSLDRHFDAVEGLTRVGW